MSTLPVVKQETGQVIAEIPISALHGYRLGDHLSLGFGVVAFWRYPLCIVYIEGPIWWLSRKYPPRDAE